MITSQSDLDKIKLLDKLFVSMSTDDLKQLVDPTLVVAALRGDETVAGPFECALDELASLRTEIASLNNIVYRNEQSMKDLLKLLKMGLFDANRDYDLRNLLQKHSIY